jgi:hypothetical protein
MRRTDHAAPNLTIVDINLDLKFLSFAGNIGGLFMI